MPDTVPEGSITVPKWAVWVGGGIAALFGSLAIPWAVALQSKMTELNITVATMAVRQEAALQLSDDMKQLRRDLAAHISDPRIHHSGLETVNRRLDRHEQRIDKIEDRKP